MKNIKNMKKYEKIQKNNKNMRKYQRITNEIDNFYT